MYVSLSLSINTYIYIYISNIVVTQDVGPPQRRAAQGDAAQADREEDVPRSAVVKLCNIKCSPSHVRPVPLLRVWVSEGLTQADS